MKKTDIIKLLKSKGEKVNNVSTLAIWESQFDDIADEILLQIKNHSDLSHVSKCPACGSSDLFKFKLEHIKCRECKEQFEHSC